MWELVSSLRQLRDPSRGALHLPWVTQVRGRLAGLPLGPALALVPPKDYIPDFLTPPPTSPLADIEGELDTLRATPSAQVRRDMEQFLRRRRTPEILQPLLDEPRRAVGELADALGAYWDATLAEHWPRIRALLEGDIAHRARRLAEGGLEALFADLHPSATFGQGSLRVDQLYDARVELGGRGLLLVPSTFSWQRVSSIMQAPWQPTVLYPARGVATLWDPGDPAPEGLARLVGQTRAQLLALLDQPRSTGDIARLLGVTPGAVSQHLKVLRGAGLVSARRNGRAVLSVRTPAADDLVSSSSS